MKLSLIIPVYNEVTVIDACLENIAALKGDLEVIFSDGGSTDGTLERISPEYTLVRAPKGRSNQMNAGARASSGDILWFSHADSILPQNAGQAIIESIEKGTRFGCFRIGFDRSGLLMSFNKALSNRRATRAHIAFGDQGMFFTRRLFKESGGFPDLPLMEDYELSLRMRRAGIPLTVLNETIITSSRRYDDRPILFIMWQMYYLRTLYRNGCDIEEIARRYKDIR